MARALHTGALEVLPLPNSPGRTRSEVMDYYVCANRCTRTPQKVGRSRDPNPNLKDQLRLAATHRVFICGYPAGEYCANCAKLWASLWDELVTSRR